jgi:hypothetical protein
VKSAQSAANDAIKLFPGPAMAKHRNGATHATEKDVDNTVKIGETIIEAIAQRTSDCTDGNIVLSEQIRTHDTKAN